MAIQHNGQKVTITKLLRRIYALDFGEPERAKRPAPYVSQAVMLALVTNYVDWGTWSKRVAAATLAESARVSLTSARLALRALEADGWISREDEHPGFSPTITVNILAIFGATDGPEQEGETLVGDTTPPALDDGEGCRQTLPPLVSDTTPLVSDTTPLVGDTTPPSGKHDRIHPLPSNINLSSIPPHVGHGGEDGQPVGDRDTGTPGEPLAALRGAWDAKAEELYPGQRSQLWDGGRHFNNPRQMQRLAPTLEHGQWLPEMFRLYCQMTDAGLQTFSQDVFTRPSLCNALRAWAEHGTEPTQVRIAREKGKGPASPPCVLTSPRKASNVLTEGGETVTGAASAIDWD